MIGNRSQFGLFGLLAFIAFLAIGFALVRLTFSTVATLGNKSISFGCMDWKYTADISGINAVVVNSSALTWKGKPMPKAFLSGRATLKTPIGDFSVLNGKWTPHFTNPPWWSNDYQPPCSIKTGFVGQRKSFDDEINQGFYKTPVNGVTITTDWDSTQLIGTPPNWVYVSLSEKNFWVDPNLFDQLPNDWER